jgi:hypothetical protein
VVGTQHALFLSMIGKLGKTDAGRWIIVDDLGNYFDVTSQDVIELYVYRRARWVQTMLTKVGGSYYASSGIPLYVGQPARTIDVPGDRSE